MKETIKYLLCLIFCGIILFSLACFVIKNIRDDINHTLTYGEWIFDSDAREWRIVKEKNKYYPQFKGHNGGFQYVESSGREPDPFYLGRFPLSFDDNLSAKKWIDGI